MHNRITPSATLASDMQDTNRTKEAHTDKHIHINTLLYTYIGLQNM